MKKEMFDRALNNHITQEEALNILEGVDTIDKFLDLIKVVAKVRENEVGRIFKFDGFIGSITPCTTEPPCKFCSRSAGNRSDFSDKPLSLFEIEFGANLMKEAGIKRVELGGGTLWSGSGEKVIEAVKTINKISSFEIWVNVGPSLNIDDLIKLRELGVKEICSSLETINSELFRVIKPGDNLEARMCLAEEIDRIGMGLTSVMMVGIGGSYEDYIRHLFWLKGFKNLSHVCITGLNPIKGTGFQDKPVTNPFEVAKIGAIARLILRYVDISFGGMMNDPKLLPLWVMAGGNRAIHMGVHVHRAEAWQKSSWGVKSSEVIVRRYDDLEFVNMLPLTTRIIREMGMEVDV